MSGFEKIVNKIAEFTNSEKHILALTNGVSVMIPFWIFICLLFMVMGWFLPLESIASLSRIVIVIMMAGMTYAVSTSVADASPVVGVMTVFFCLLCSSGTDIVHELPVWLIVGLMMGSVTDVCKNIKWNSEVIPGGVTACLVEMVPYVLMCIVGALMFFYGEPVFYGIRACFAFLAGIMDSFPAVCLIVASVCLLWTCGMHGDDLVAVFVRPFWMYMSLCNFSAWANGSALPYVTSESFYQWFIWIGGTGATLGLVLDYLLFSKDKLFGKQTFKGGIFNINEEVIFGLPIVNNRKMVVPFVAAPMMITTIAYFAIAKGMVNAPVGIMPWVLPAPLGAFFSCLMDYRALLLVVLNIVVTMAVYLPFLKRSK